MRTMDIAVPSKVEPSDVTSADAFEANFAVPAANRFVRLDDNLPAYDKAIASLERLIAGMNEIRVNDWPEKEGMLASVRATIEMIRTKYVNRTSLLATIASVATFLMTKFAEAPMSELANAAWTAVKALFLACPRFPTSQCRRRIMPMLNPSHHGESPRRPDEPLPCLRFLV